MQPLAFRVRPQTIQAVIGQEHLVAPGGVLYAMATKQQLFSMIFFGPPGTGKTTMAMLLAKQLNRPFRLFNAVTGTKKDLDAIYAEARLSNGLVLIMDEVHRLNKDKQDTLLPFMEEGLVTLIGATTSNPYFAINPAIRSRCHLIEFHSLKAEDLVVIMKQAMEHPDGLNHELILSDDLLMKIAENSNGDARYALNVIELLHITHPQETITEEIIEGLSIRINIGMDKDDDNHYDLLSAFQKSIRGSDVDAALYYLARLIEVGDLLSLERRLIVTAYEDIGLANSALVGRVMNAIDAVKRVGFPEGRIPLANIVIELALSPKSKSAEIAIDKALASVATVSAQIPRYLRLKAVGVDPEEMYDYDRSDLWHLIQYLPDRVKNEHFYEPQNMNSNEKVLKQNLDTLRQYKRSNNLKTLKQKKKNK